MAHKSTTREPRPTPHILASQLTAHNERGVRVRVGAERTNSLSLSHLATVSGLRVPKKTRGGLTV